jgi:hypothetical protein
VLQGVVEDLPEPDSRIRGKCWKKQIINCSCSNLSKVSRKREVSFKTKISNGCLLKS